jgi:hypothetical protein
MVDYVASLAVATGCDPMALWQTDLAILDAMADMLREAQQR